MQKRRRRDPVLRSSIFRGKNMDNPGFYAILPASVRYDGRLKAAEKILFCEITALSDQNGYCHAQNGYFSGLYGVDESTVRRWIRNLKNLGYIQVEYSVEGDTQQRRITPCADAQPGGCPVPAPGKITRTPRAKMPDPPGQKCPHNNTSINNTRYNNIRAREERRPEDVFGEYAGVNASLANTLADFSRYREQKKKPLSTEGAVRLCRRLDALAKEAAVNDVDGYKVAVLDQSILNNWDGVFPLKYEYKDKAVVHISPGGAAPAPRKITDDTDITQFF